MDTREVAAGIVWRAGLVLAARRRPGTFMEGWWEFPGGKLEAGESPRQALCRELKEELGIRASRAEFWLSKDHVYEDRGLKVRLYFFHVMAFEGDPEPVEGQELRWIAPAEASDRDFLPADADVLDLLRKLDRA